MKRGKILLIFFSVLLLNLSIVSAQSESISLIKIIPNEFKSGDVQFSLQVQNNNNETVQNLIALVTGNGFSTYDVIPVDSLAKGERGYILVSGNFKNSGNINLSIRINQDIFYRNVVIFSSQNASELEKQEQEKKAILANLSIKLDVLDRGYFSLDSLLSQKKYEGYDVVGISLNDLKIYLRDAEAAILAEDIDTAKIKIKLAEQEYNYQKIKIENVRKISSVSQLKDYAIIFSALAGSIITFFALYELLKQKGKATVSTVKTISKKKFKQ